MKGGSTRDPNDLPWRTGRTVGRTLYDCTDRLIGTLDTPELAARVVDAVNRIGELETRIKDLLQVYREATGVELGAWVSASDAEGKPDWQPDEELRRLIEEEL